jgi:hypothetical protein
VKVRTTLFLVFVCGVLYPLASNAAESLPDRIKSLEPIIGGHPPNIRSEEEFNSVKKKYEALKAELDSLLLKQPNGADLLFLRGHLQSMGHNFDYPGAWEGSTDDLRKLLKANPSHVPALLELGNLWVNSNPQLAPNAEQLFRGAQCYYGSQPLEPAQRGVFFALYYQGKMKEALKQSAYLVKTWPKKEQYRRLNEMTRTVLARAEKNGETSENAETLVMASCNE